MFRGVLISMVAALLACAPAFAKPVSGEIPTEVQVGAGGALQYTVPIPTLPGTAGMQPKLSLSYSSQGGPGVAGMGWTIAGLSKITRGPKNLATDGATRAVALDGDDAFYIDGLRLIPIAVTTAGGKQTVEFRKEIDDQSRAFAVLDAKRNPVSFTVKTKAGLMLEFGGAGATVSIDSIAAVWLARRIADTSGNYLEFSYSIAGVDYDIEAVSYTGHAAAPVIAPYAEVRFDYEATPEYATAYVHGQRLQKTRRLKSIRSRMLNPAIDAFVVSLTYEDTISAGRFRLKEVGYQASTGDSYRPLRFGYGDPPANPWTATASFQVPVEIAGSAGADAFRFARTKVAAGSVPSLLYAAEGAGGLDARTYEQGAGGWTPLAGKAAPTAFVDSGGRSRGVVVVDFDGDGLDDLVVSRDEGGVVVSEAFNQTATDWKKTAGYASPIAFAKDGVLDRVVVVDLNGDTKGDLVRIGQDGTVETLLNLGDKWQAQASLPAPAGRRFGPELVDADCDGRPEVAVLAVSGGRTKLMTYAYSGGWTLQPGWEKDVGDAADGVNLATYGEKCGALFVGVRDAVANTVTTRAFEASTTGWTETAALAPPAVLFWTSDGKVTHPRAADLNGDGHADLVASETWADGTAIDFTYTQLTTPDPMTGAMWQVANGTGQLASPFRLAVDGRWRRSVEFRPLDADKYIDVIDLERRGPGVAGAYVGTGATFVSAAAYSPPVEFARSGQQDIGIRFVDLNGDGLVDLLYNRKDGGAAPGGCAGGVTDRGAFINRGNQWACVDGYIPPKVLPTSVSAAAGVALVDVNNDGFVDLVYSYRTAAGTEIRETYLNGFPNGKEGWEPASPAWQTPLTIAEERLDAREAFRVLDVNGDGRIDLIRAYETFDGKVVTDYYENTGAGWTAKTRDLPAGFVIYRAQFTGTPDGVAHQFTYSELVDVDGDRAPDLVERYRDDKTSLEVSNVFRWDGAKYAKTGWTAPQSLDEQRRTPNANGYFFDVNGDGLPDFYFYDGHNATIYAGSGEGWIREAGYDVPAEALSEAYRDAATRFVDLNGDGLVDIAYHFATDPGKYSKGAYLNVGNKWQKAADTYAPPIPFLAENGSDLGVRPLDVDGNGLPDLLKSFKSGDAALDQQTWLNVGRRADVLEVAEDSAGVTTRIRYNALGEYRPVTPGGAAERIYEHGLASAWPTISISPTMYVVARLVTDEGASRQRATRYRYGDLRMDVAWARALGFAWKETIDEASGLVTRTTFKQDRVLAGLVATERSSLPDPAGARLLSERSSDWTFASLQGLNRPDGQPYQYAQTRLNSSVIRTFDLDGSALSDETTEFRSFDAYGNITLVVTTRSDGSKLTTENTYDSNPDAAWLGRLRQSTVTKTLAGAGPVCDLPLCERRQAEFTYEPDSLLLRTEKANAASSQYAVTTTYGRDPFGNVISKTVSPDAADVPNRVETYAYLQGEGRLIASTTDAIGDRVESHYETPLSLAIGVATRELDANGLTTTRVHDGFGRRVSERDPTKVVKTTETLLAADIPAMYLVGLDHVGALRPNACLPDPLPIWRVPIVDRAVLTYSAVAGTGLRQTPEVVIVDRAGRVIRRIASVFDGTTVRLAFSDVEYDDLGRVIGKSLAYFSGQTPRFTRVQYDRMGRAIAAATPNAACVTTTFAGLKITSRTRTAAAKPWREKVTTLNLSGKPVTVRDAKLGLVRFEYDAGDRVRKVTGATGAVVEYRFDDGGRRYWLSDPDSGVWRYQYDSFGRLTEQKDPIHAGNPRRISYDVMGRVAKIETAEHTTVFTFRAKGTPCGAGRLASVDRSPVNAGWGPRYLEVYDYDGFCRAQGVTIDITAAPSGPRADLLPQASYKSRQEYDAFGRVQISRYPMTFGTAQFAARNTYHPDTGALLFVDEYNSNDTFGRRLWSLTAADANGRVTREKRGASLNITHEYDVATGAERRLTATGAAGAVADQTYEYDLVGNLLSRKDKFGTAQAYRYDELDRLTDVVEGGAVVQSVKYDAAGRITYKSDVGHYRYGADCGALQPGEAWRPAHGLCGVSASAASSLTERYRYDELGQIVRSPRANFYHNADNQVERIVQRGVGEDDETLFAERYAYGPRGQLFLEYNERQTTPAGFRATATYRLGQYDNEVRVVGASKVVVDRFYVSAPTGVIGFVESTDYTKAAGLDLPPAMAAKPIALRLDPGHLFFVVRDRLGSVSAITTESGKLVRRFAYDPWGRAKPSTSLPVDLQGDELSARWAEGYTGHQHLLIGSAVTDLIHMGGRVYDARLGVFLTPDPIFSDPTSSQDLNPYMYAVGNSLKYTDPSGFGWLSDFFSNPGKALADLHRNFVNEVGKGLSGIAHWVASDWRQIVGIAVGIVIAVYCPPCMANPIVGGFIIGAAQAGTTAALYGGDSSQVLEASMRGGAVGAVGGAASYAAGSYIQASGVGANSWQAATAHGVGGGVTSVVSGGRFEQGFVSGAFTQYVTQNTRIESLKGPSRYAANAALGGASAELGGGKFANGAMYGAFQSLFNDGLHELADDPPVTQRAPASAHEEDWSNWGEGASWFNFSGEVSVNPTLTPSLGGFSLTPNLDLQSGQLGLDASYSYSVGYGFVSMSNGGDVMVGASWGPKLPRSSPVSLDMASAGIGTNVRTAMPNALINVRAGPVSATGRATMGDAWANAYKNLERALTSWRCSYGGCGVTPWP